VVALMEAVEKVAVHLATVVVDLEEELKAEEEEEVAVLEVVGMEVAVLGMEVVGMGVAVKEVAVKEVAVKEEEVTVLVMVVSWVVQAALVKMVEVDLD
jgi:hypothetical protein